MEGYKREFIKFLEDAGVLKFGDFTAKSGRKIPYFINAGDIKTGEQIQKLGEFYAKAYFEKVGNKRAVLYGPAYKGIPIAVSVAVALAREGLDVPFFFNRKEEKDHGEGGVFDCKRHTGCRDPLYIGWHCAGKEFRTLRGMYEMQMPELAAFKGESGCFGEMGKDT